MVAKSLVAKMWEAQYLYHSHARLETTIEELPNTLELLAEDCETLQIPFCSQVSCAFHPAQTCLQEVGMFKL